ncbi:4-coumarate-CoA ligase [Paracoccidioides lutzii Pb01]|uniref:4-coumarate-CoA ligase n=1 Tax=Paracoccidioides lutzii (strain ATCC MYA-826 / Pb01) TaxID=502779 RepID=C1H1V2_PARBA|nr:4-coumarate-CoA ligase [Paracoccidioides lutzii Pb01]EEH33839.1 4-coumarate-CoA ligase [Paracoccidioides lutzii Pb01]
MVFTPPKWVGPAPEPPDAIPISEFMLKERYGRHPLEYSRHPFVCGLSKKSYSALEVAKRVDVLARSLCKELDWQPNNGSEYQRVACIYSVNTIDYMTLCWAIHRCSGIASPANATYSAPELAHQLKDSGSKSLFTCATNLPIALEAAANVGIPKSRVYLLDLPSQFPGGGKAPDGYITVEQLIKDGYSLPKLEKLNWQPGQGVKQTAFLCYSSGTSGLPKGVMISHRNVIANTLQIKEYEVPYRKTLKNSGSQSGYTDVILGLLPQSHIYALVVICHSGPYRGDQVVILPKFDFTQYLGAIERCKVSTLYLVPPIIIIMLRNKEACDKRDLSSVTSIFTGAAPLGVETATDLMTWKPSWKIRQGYGLTETSTVVSNTSPHDIFLGSSGSLIPGFEARLLSPDGEEITGYDQPGELVVRSPSVALGYLNNEEATKETFRDGWMRTGDEAVFRVSPAGNEHLFIVDRIKELIKVKGLQVAPAELEAHLLSHSDVADCSVIAVPDEIAGELPKAFVVKSPSAGSDDAATIRSIEKHVEDHKARHKWLKGGVEFIDVIPKSPSGKILRRLLRDREREARRKAGVKL